MLLTKCDLSVLYLRSFDPPSMYLSVTSVNKTVPTIGEIWTLYLRLNSTRLDNYKPTHIHNKIINVGLKSRELQTVERTCRITKKVLYLKLCHSKGFTWRFSFALERSVTRFFQYRFEWYTKKQILLHFGNSRRRFSFRSKFFENQ